MKGAGKGGWSEMTVFFGGRFIDCSPVVERFGERGVERVVVLARFFLGKVERLVVEC